MVLGIWFGAAREHDHVTYSLADARLTDYTVVDYVTMVGRLEILEPRLLHLELQKNATLRHTPERLQGRKLVGWEFQANAQNYGALAIRGVGLVY